MTFDWFTLIAQLLNFALLLVLLRVFLFRPIQRVMQEREEGIARAHAEAQVARSNAEAQAHALALEREGFAAERQERFAALAAEVARARDERHAALTEEIAKARESWRVEFEREREALAAEVRTVAATVLRDALERGWRDLADQDLEAHALTVFARRLAGLGADDRAALADAVRAGPVRFATAFETTEPQREALRSAARAAVAAAPGGGRGGDAATVQAAPDGAGDPLEAATFVRDPDLLAGVRLRAGDRRVGWTVQAHLEDLERAWATVEPGA